MCKLPEANCGYEMMSFDKNTYDYSENTKIYTVCQI